MKAIFINTENRTVSQISIDPQLESYYSMIGCKLITVAGSNELSGDVIYSDDEALLSDRKGDFFTLPSFGDGWICGNAIIVGTNDHGEDVDCKSNLEDIQELIRFATASDLNRAGISTDPFIMVISVDESKSWDGSINLN